NTHYAKDRTTPAASSFPPLAELWAEPEAGTTPSQILGGNGCPARRHYSKDSVESGKGRFCSRTRNLRTGDAGAAPRRRSCETGRGRPSGSKITRHRLVPEAPRSKTSIIPASIN